MKQATVPYAPAARSLTNSRRSSHQMGREEREAKARYMSMKKREPKRSCKRIISVLGVTQILFHSGCVSCWEHEHEEQGGPKRSCKRIFSVFGVTQVLFHSECCLNEKLLSAWAWRTGGAQAVLHADLKCVLCSACPFSQGMWLKKERDVVKCCQVHKHEKLRPQVILQTYF